MKKVSDKKMEAVLGELISYHSKKLGLGEIPFKVVDELADDAPEEARAVACMMQGSQLKKILAFMKLYGIEEEIPPGMILFKRSALQHGWGDPHLVEDLVVHELMHFKVRGPDGGHGPKYQKAMADYGFCGRSCGSAWRKTASKIINGRDGWGSNWFESEAKTWRFDLEI